MRVIQLTNWHRFGGGSDYIARKTARLLENGGHHVRLLAHDSQALSQSARGKVTAFLRGVYSPAAIREMRGCLESFRPDVVHVHEVYPHHSPWVLAECRRAGVPVVMTCHDYRLTCPVATHLSRGAACTRCASGAAYWCAINNCRGNRLESIAYASRGAVAHAFSLFRNNVSQFVAPSENLRQHMIAEGGFDADKFVVIPNMVDYVADACNPASGEYMAYAGRIAPEKGIDTLIEAARISGLPLQIAGAAGESYRRSSGVNVVWRGHLPHDQLAAFYRNARFVVTPSRWQGAFGLVPAEAMMHGLPVIASRIGALPELVDHGVTGLLFTPEDATELARCMSSLWPPPPHRAVLSCSVVRYSRRCLRC